MIRAIIIDDEAMSRTSLKYLAEKTGKVEIIAQFDRAMAAVECIEKDRPDLIFLDIQMPNLNGIEFLRLHAPRCKVILVSSDPSHGPDAFSLDVSNYLLKPVSPSHIAKCIDRIELELESESERDYVAFKAQNGLIRLDCEQVAFIKTLDDYLEVHLVSKERHLTHSTLKRFMELLPEQFFRCHQSIAINLNHVEELRKNDVLVAGEYLPVSRSKKTELAKILSL